MDQGSSATEGKRTWLAESYFGFLSGQIAESIQYLHRSIGWAIATVTASFGFVFTRDQFDLLSLGASLFGLIFLFHFAYRAARGYVNVLRFSYLLKKISLARIGDGLDSQNWDEGILGQLRADIRTYHIDWSCPISIPRLVENMLTSFGFGYFFTFQIILIVYLIVDIWSVETIPGIIFSTVFAVAVLLWEGIWGFSKSGYFKSIKPTDKL